jgi:uncharacterized glyoxalase superfamily protein PhnB
MAAGGMQRAEQEQLPTVSTPATAMRYRDVGAAADWLCAAFGFETQTVLTDDSGRTLYAQLTFGRALLMLAPVGDSPIEKFMKQPDEVGGAETQSIYFVIADADAHHARARAAGAEVVLPVEDDDFGGRGYTCRDPEGHIWTFGTYDPWQGKFPVPAAPVPAPPSGGRRIVVGSLTAVALVVVGVAAWFGGMLSQSGAVSSAAQIQPQPMPAGAAALEAAERAARVALIQLEHERAAKAAADKASDEAQKQAAEARQGREAAERAVKDVRAELERERAKKAAQAAAQASAADISKRLEEESRAREAAERSNKEVRAELERERERARKTAETPPELVKRVEEESRARQAAEKIVKEIRAELEQERARKVTQTAAQASAADISKRLDEESRVREAAERSVKAARAELEKARADKTAAEMAKDFALGRAEEEQAAREAAERAVEEVRAELQRQKDAAKPADAAGKKGADDGQKAMANLQKALDRAHKLGADEKRAREEAERAVEEAREDATRERTAKNAAWKMVLQLRRQLKQGQGEASATDTAGTAGDDSPPPKRPRARPKKTAEPE